MKISIKKIIDRFNDTQSLESKIFWTVVPLTGIVFLVAAVIAILEGIETMPIVLVVVSMLICIVISIVCYKHHNYDACYTAFCTIISCVMLPMAIITNGGIHSGMPLLCIVGTFLCSFCINKKSRIITFILSLTVNIFVLTASIYFPNIVNAISSYYSETDIIITYAIVSVSILVVCSVVLREVKDYVDTNLVLSRHMDWNLQYLLLNRSKSRSFLGDKCNTAVMFADISNFTSLSETMEPETITQFLNVFFEVADECIHRNGGVIDKYIGDCVMAFWIDTDKDLAAEKACQAALDIKAELAKRCENVYRRFKCDLEFSAGINYGDSIIGDVGSKNRQDFTVIGDAVNIASRLQSIAPAGGIYVSTSVAMIVKDKFELIRVPKKVVLKGKSAPVDIYTLVSNLKKDQEVDILPQSVPTGYILYVCGSRGSYALAGKRYAEFGGETSCYLIKKDDYVLIIDCGSGLQRAREIIADCTKIDVILTHVHYDHIIGLLDWSIFPQNAEMKFYGNFDHWLGDKTISRLFEKPFWPVDPSEGELVSVEVNKKYSINSDISAVFYPASHPNETNLVVLNVKEKRICIMADCENPTDLPEREVNNCDILIYDGMYEDKYYNEHIGWGHSTWESGVALALNNKVGRLIISHHNPRNSDEKLRGLEMQAQEIYPATTFAKAGDRFPI